MAAPVNADARSDLAKTRIFISLQLLAGYFIIHECNSQQEAG
ncbi:hypothetical protein [Rhizobium mongolense]|uniref:Uncharacterized protein n=1 Tax=Rhizobium mongolense TaxID=57676 RepID=A0A7W6RMI0_9HYPH|nr:hypothetical protein [Rhizobium mongolense]MBB4275199.1 hypothetical protein [Rhizobium mongolense]